MFCLFQFLKAQTDSSFFDKLTPEELQKYYENEPEFKYYKGPLHVGDSLFKSLQPWVVPTQTVHAPTLYHEDRDLPGMAIESDTAGQKDLFALKPKISLGAGRLNYFGDLHTKKFQNPLIGRWGYHLEVSQQLNEYLQLNFFTLFGKLSATEWDHPRRANFLSEIRSGGAFLLYDFGNWVSPKYMMKPFISLGICGFEFLSKTDLKDKNGNLYHYWSDGTIRNMPEDGPDAHQSIIIQRDYNYETDIRENNVDLFGRYPERSFAIPIGIGFVAKVTDRFDVKFGYQFFITKTDYIDGITNKNGGNKRGDYFGYTSLSLQYDLLYRKIRLWPERDKPKNTLDFLAMDKEDRDEDGVRDWDDLCHGTPKGVKVNFDGCPEDLDQDGIPDYRDDEPQSPPGALVDAKGVAVNDEYWANWYSQYLNDTIDPNPDIVYLGNIYTNKENTEVAGELRKSKDYFTVELARYKGAIPPDELSLLLSIGDIESVMLEDGTTVVYTAGNYKKVKTAIKRRDEFRAMGHSKAVVAIKSGKNIQPITDEEALQLSLKPEGDLSFNPKKLKQFSNTQVKKDTVNFSQNNSLSQNNNINANSGNGSVTSIDESEMAMEENFGPNDIIYRVQLGAFKNRISTEAVFNVNVKVLELKTGENIYRYVTKGFKTIEQAAAVRADLVLQGYSDAFVTAYKGGKRILMSQAGGIVEKGYKEDLNENKTFSSINKKLVVFRIQLGANKRPNQVAAAEEKYKGLGEIIKQNTTTGNVRMMVGTFSKYDDAEKFRKELEKKGITEGFIVAFFKDELISIQEAMELLK
ncbi:MAG: SPOR domain-containing protein [Bacteroidia bacterium]|nr:SPOR domain-containing protein [Bacteroidia bacterium]